MATNNANEVFSVCCVYFIDTMAPELLFADIKSIRRYELTTGIYDEFVMNLTRIVALDFDIRSGKIFFTDVTENKIYVANYASLSGTVSKVSSFFSWNF